MRIYRSLDDGTLYRERDVEAFPDHFTPYEVPDTIKLKPEQLCVGCNDIMEVLLRARIARKVE